MLIFLMIQEYEYIDSYTKSILQDETSPNIYDYYMNPLNVDSTYINEIMAAIINLTYSIHSFRQYLVI